MDRSELLANARLAAIVRSSDDAIIGKDLNGIITDWNRSAELMFGYSAEEAIGRHISIIAPPGREWEMRDILDRIVQGEIVEHFETQRCAKDGALVDISLTVSPIRDPEGRIVGASKVARDISEQNILRNERSLLAAVVSSSDDAIVSKDLNGIVTSWNTAAERLFGYSAKEMIGHPISVLAPPERVDEMRQILERIRRGERIEHFETQRRRKDGVIADISLTVSPIHDFRGKVIGASKIARDIGERRRAEQRLWLLTRELDHRAKNVLTVAQAMLRLTRAESMQEYVHAVEGRIKALARIHNRMAENRWDGAEIGSLFTADIDVFSEVGGRMTAEGQPLWVSPAAAQVIAMIIHELATNASKHGALSSDQGSVAMHWDRDSAGDLHWSWSELGGPTVERPSRRGFGMQIIERGVPDQLGGSAELNWLPAGLKCNFVVPAEHVVAPSRAYAT